MQLYPRKLYLVPFWEDCHLKTLTGAERWMTPHVMARTIAGSRTTQASGY
jgi:hypothetical protein